MSDAGSKGGGGTKSMWHRPASKTLETAMGTPGRAVGEIRSERPLGRRIEVLKRKRRVLPSAEVCLHAFGPAARDPFLRAPNPGVTDTEREGANARKIAALASWIAYPHKPARDLDAPIRRRVLFVDIAIEKGPKWQRPAPSEPPEEVVPGIAARPVAKLEARPVPKPRMVTSALRGRRRRPGI